ncbi:T9SS type A sorting domain-containing protein [Reichenbachiella sp. MALMAid0571]|uniref:exo-rhamnogalacturonan lyase family protein n=1 Tax=Reichenbachiella sp. MALMAid0571 TaxID=3143939 RepID=UPI0032DF7056
MALKLDVRHRQTWRLIKFLLIVFALNNELKAQLKIQVEDHSGIARKSWPVTGGVPFAKGSVFQKEDIGLAEKASQSRVLSRWSDGSIKWLLLDYQVDIEPENKSSDTIIMSGESLSEGNELIESNDEIFVDTGVLKFSVSKNKFGFINQMWLDLNNNGKYELGEQIVSANSGQDHFIDLQANNPNRPTIPYSIRNLNEGTSRSVINEQPTVKGGSRWIRPEGGGEETRKRARDGIYTAEIVEHGSLRTVIKLKGRIGSSGDDNDYSIWIHAYNGKSFLRIQHNFMFRGNPQITNIRRMGLTLPLDFTSAPKFKAAGLPKDVTVGNADNAYLYNAGPEDVFHLEHNSFPLYWKVQAGTQNVEGTQKTDGWIEVNSGKFGVTMVMKDMAYKYPKELSYNGDGKSLTAWMWPDHGNQVLDLRASGWDYGMQGISFSHDIFYNFSGKADELKSSEFAALVNDPLQPYVNPDWYSYKETKAAGMIMPHSDDKFPKTEALLATGTTFIERSMTEFGWLGMLNYGDMMFMYAYQKEDRPLGTWGISSRSDDYDGWRRGNTMISYRLFMQYLRTGEYRYWKAASAHLEFVRDVLIKHYNSNDSRFVGFGRRHSAYWGVTPADENDRNGGVAWDGYGTNWLGHYLHWNMTGDWRTYEVINDIRYAWNEWGNKDVDQIKGGAFVGLKLIGGIPGYEEAVTEADSFYASALDRTANPGDEWRDNTWFFGYGLYLQDNPHPGIEKAIIDWWKAGKHNKDRWGLYWHRESMSAAYWAAKDDYKMRNSIYKELSTIGSTESQSSSRIEAQSGLYKTYGLSGLFDCDIVPLADAVTKDTQKGYWRAKDDIMQQQWDEPLGMAVIDHYRENLLTSVEKKDSENSWFDLAVDSTNMNELYFKITLDRASDFELEVFTMTGQSVWNYNQTEKKKGEYKVAWNGYKDSKGKERNGFYIVRLMVDSDQKTRKFIVR